MVDILMLSSMRLVRVTTPHVSIYDVHCSLLLLQGPSSAPLSKLISLGSSSGTLRASHQACSQLVIDQGCELFPRHAHNHHFTPSILDGLTAHFPGGSLLPNLSVLQISCPGAISWHSLSVLFGPSLSDFIQEIDVDLDAPKTDRAAYMLMLSQLQQRSPSVRNLSLSIPSCQNEVAPSAMKTFNGFQSLVIMSIEGIPLILPVLHRLTILLSLQIINARLAMKIEEADLNACRNPGDAVYYPNLLDMTLIHPHNLAACTAIIGSLCSVAFKEVKVKCYGSSMPVQQATDLFETLGCHPSRQSITRFSLFVGLLEGESVLDGGALRSLTKVPNLSWLDIDIAPPVALSNTILFDIISLTCRTVTATDQHEVRNRCQMYDTIRCVFGSYPSLFTRRHPYAECMRRKYPSQKFYPASPMYSIMLCVHV